MRRPPSCTRTATLVPYTTLFVSLAAGAAATLEPLFSRRVLWLLNMPTGLVILILNRYIPESPRFLSNAGLESQARAVLRKFSGSASTIEHEDRKSTRLNSSH